MRYYITIIILLAAATTTYAQGQPVLSIGKRGSQYQHTQLITEKLSASVLKDDPALYVAEEGKRDGDKYLVPSYEISIEEANGTAQGPFVVKDGNEQSVFDKIYPFIEPGAKVSYNKIMIVCRTCMPPAPAYAKGVVVTVE